MKVRINLNEKVKFKLSERGKEIYRHRYDGLEPNLDDDGYMSMQLWTFMQTFGEHMIPGMYEVVQPLEIIYEQEDEWARGDAESATTTDCIRRQDVLDLAKDGKIVSNTNYKKVVAHINNIPSATFTDCISRADAIEALGEEPDIAQDTDEEWAYRDAWVEHYQAILSLLPVTPTEQTDCTDFINWLLAEVLDEENWELNAVANGEIICRKLKKLDLLEVKDGYYVRASVTPPERTGEWVSHELWDMPWFTCSECNYHGRSDFKFCPNCGAKMGGDTEW